MITKFAIIIPTYHKPDGSTKSGLTRAIESILNQKYQNWKIFLIGDKYENDDEFKQISSIVHSDKIFAINRLDAVVERDIYPNPSKQLWCAGGCSSIKFGIRRALNHGFDFICPLDHDDWWHEDHLLNFAKAIEKHPDLFFLAARSQTYKPGEYLPPTSTNIGLGYIPERCKVIHSSTCIKFSETNIRYRDTFERTGITRPGDADLWNRLSAWMLKNNKLGYYTGVVTCFKSEGYSALPVRVT